MDTRTSADDENRVKEFILPYWKTPPKVSLKDKVHAVLKDAEKPGEAQSTNGGPANWALERIPVELFCQMDHTPKVVEIPSDTSVARALDLLVENNLWGAPVCNVAAPASASWTERYLGMVDFAGIALWILKLSASEGLMDMGPAADAAHHSHKDAEARATLTMGGNFMATLQQKAVFQNTKVEVSDIAGTFRWAPFIPVHLTDSVLSVFLLVSHYRLKAIPLLSPQPGTATESGAGIGGSSAARAVGSESGTAQSGSVRMVISQMMALHMLADCDGLPWFDDVADKTLEELGLPSMQPEQVVKVTSDAYILEPFEMMLAKKIGGVAVVAAGSNALLGNISVRDINALLHSPHLFSKRGTLRVSDFMEGNMSPPIVCKKADSLRSVIHRLDVAQIHRIYVVDEDMDLQGLITISDVIRKIVTVPPNYGSGLMGSLAA